MREGFENNKIYWKPGTLGSCNAKSYDSYWGLSPTNRRLAITNIEGVR